MYVQVILSRKYHLSILWVLFHTNKKKMDFTIYLVKDDIRLDIGFIPESKLLNTFTSPTHKQSIIISLYVV